MLAAVWFPPFSLLGADAGAPVTERDVALWVMREGGRVLLDGAVEYTSDPFELPAGEVHLAGVDMHGTLADPKELESLRHLTGLRELYIPARVWSPASDIKALPTLESLDLGGPHPGAGGRGARKARQCRMTLPHAIATLKQLRTLNLSYSQIGADGLRNSGLARSCGEAGARRLVPVDDQALVELAKWKSLRFLDVQATKVTAQGIAVLEKAKPGIAVLSGPFAPPEARQ